MGSASFSTLSTILIQSISSIGRIELAIAGSTYCSRRNPIIPAYSATSRTLRMSHRSRIREEEG